MKVVKELGPSLFHSLRLLLVPTSRLLTPKNEPLPVIVSLTSIPSRINTLHIVIRSLLTQDRIPKKIVLWLNEGLKNNLPHNLVSLQSPYFEICFSDLISSHRKLVHSMEKYPDEVIVTCDDDMIYRRNWLRLLYKEHLKNPSLIIGNRTVTIKHDPKGNPLSFKLWRHPDKNEFNPRAVLAIGAWGILYPPNSLSEQAIDSDLFMNLAPLADDLWFKAMALVKGTITSQATSLPKEPIPIIGSQKVALKKENITQDKNTEVWEDLNEHFKLNKIILQK